MLEKHIFFSTPNVLNAKYEFHYVRIVPLNSVLLNSMIGRINANSEKDCLL